MADYYSILNKTISGLAKNTGEVRAMVYDKARTAIEKQMQAMDPLPSEAAIAAQMKQLEEAISKLETENSAASEPSGAAVETHTPEPEVKEEVPASPPPPPEPLPVWEQVSGEAPEEPDIEPTPATGEETDAEKPPVSESSDAVAEPVVESHPAEINAAPDAEGEVHGSGEEAPQVSSSESEISAPYDDLRPTAETSATQSQATHIPSPDAPPSIAELEPAPRPHEMQQMSQQNPAGGSGGAARFVGKLLPYVLALLVLGGGAYALWMNKDALVQAFGTFTKTEDVVSVSEPEQESEPAVEPEPEPEVEIAEPEAPAENNQPEVKEAVRLGENGEDVVADPVEPDAVSGQTEVPLVLEPAPETSEPEVTVEPVVEPNLSEEEVATTEPAEIVTPAIGDTAYLYEEGGSSEGAARSNAGVIWSLGSESPEDGLPEEAVIMAQLDVPEKALSMNLKIKRNTDEALSASHIIELVFTAPESFTGGSIDNVARFVMKSTEQARGEGLIAVPVRIDAGYFLIALNNLQQAVDTNSKLLLESAWIDIPLGYTSGRRALITFEKGETGEKVFKDAFEDWKNR